MRLSSTCAAPSKRKLKPLRRALQSGSGGEEYREILLDPGASYHLVPGGTEMNGSREIMSEEGLVLRTVDGARQFQESGELDAGPIGAAQAIIVGQESPAV